MKAILSPFAGSRIDTIPNLGDAESAKFGNQLDEIFHEAGWKTGLWYAQSIGPLPSILLRVSTKDVPEDVKARLMKSQAESREVMPLPRGDLPERTTAVLDALATLGVQCPVVFVDELPTGQMQLRVGGNQ